MTPLEEINIAAVEFPVDENGTPIFALAEGSGDIVGYTRLWRLTFPVVQLEDGRKVPAIRLLGDPGSNPAGASDYEDLKNLPKVNGVTFVGSMTGADLKLASLSDLTQMQNDIETLKTELLGAAAVSDSLQNTIYGEETP